MKPDPEFGDFRSITKIKPVLDPFHFISYQYAWYQILLDILQRCQAVRFTNMTDLITVLRVYERMYWNVIMTPSDPDKQMCMDEDDELVDWIVESGNRAYEKFFKEYIDTIVEYVEQVESGNTSRQYMFDPRSYGSILYGLFDSPEGLINWMLINMTINNPTIRNYKSFIIKQLRKFNIDI